MKKKPKPACFAILAISLLGWQSAAKAAQFFEFNFEVTGYRDVSEQFFNRGSGPAPLTDASLNIQILGTDNNADGVLEFRQYEAVWTDNFGTITHSLDDVISYLAFDRLSLPDHSIFVDSNRFTNDPNNDLAEVINFTGSSLDNLPRPYFSYLETSQPGFGVARSCGGYNVLDITHPCSVTATAKKVPEHLGPLASVLVLGLGIWLKKRVNSRPTTSGH